MQETNLIDTQKEWDSTAARLSQEPQLALDTESNSLYAYRERVCLIQISTREETFLLDPLSVDDLSALGQLLANPSIIKILHGSDYDLRCFDRDYQFNIRSLFDTETAARFLGETSPNLAWVLENFLNVRIPKSRKVQRSNWAKRPLSPLASEYAANDVRYLVELAHELRRRLAGANRLEWVQEELQRMEKSRYSAPDPPNRAFLRVKGTDRLGPQALTVFRELFLWRDAEAQSREQPAFRVMNNETLLDLARVADGLSSPSPARVREALPKAPGRMRDGMQAAIEKGLTAPEAHRPQPSRSANPWTQESRSRLQQLKQWRVGQGESLQLDPALLWPAVSLERLALQPQDWQAELLDEVNGDVRSWQRREFSWELQALLEVGD